MFIGHFAVAFGAKRWLSGISLGTLFLACQLADLLWPVLVLLGVERVDILPGATAVTPMDFVHYPYSHSLVAMALWGLLLGLALWFARRASGSVALAVAAIVVSHWLLDFVTHRPDMPLTLEGAGKFGLGLWNSRVGTVIVEDLLYAAGVLLYVRATRPKDGIGRWALAGLVLFLFLVSTVNLLSPPPPSARAVASTALSMWLLVAWGYWVDRHRVPGAPIRSAA
jgi:hypothetical protein